MLPLVVLVLVLVRLPFFCAPDLSGCPHATCQRLGHGEQVEGLEVEVDSIVHAASCCLIRDYHDRRNDEQDPQVRAAASASDRAPRIPPGAGHTTTKHPSTLPRFCRGRTFPTKLGCSSPRRDRWGTCYGATSEHTAVPDQLGRAAQHAADGRYEGGAPRSFPDRSQVQRKPGEAGRSMPVGRHQIVTERVSIQPLPY